ncbi:MAG TPA: aminotransferase class V-fold PLP-dependent enzyme [Acidimicrobiales bacterium]|nr:aminotransferase class V-fold PLP-dependent enzyme [Acidimicrobiales bacterium]
MNPLTPPVPLVGDETLVPCADGEPRRYLSCDAAASTAPFPAVLAAVQEFMPWYSSVHRGAGYKSQRATEAYEGARDSALRFAGREGKDDVAVFCRNTTEAVNHLAYRLGLLPGDVVVTTVVEHHANMLPWLRLATCRFVECGRDGTFTAGDIETALDARPRPRLLAITGASNITGWVPPLDEVLLAARERDIAVLVDAAQLAPHRPVPKEADFLVWSGHKMYAPFGAGVLIGPRRTFLDGEPFLVGGGAVDLVTLDEVVWTAPPDREEAGSPNVVGAIALRAAIEQFELLGWPALRAHDRELATALRKGIAAIEGVTLLGPPLGTETLPVATFTVKGLPHALVAARLSAEDAIGVRHGCFCAHPYLLRLLGLGADEVERYRVAARAGERAQLPGAVRASLGVNGSLADVERLCHAVARLASGEPPPVPYEQDPRTGDFSPPHSFAPWMAVPRRHPSSCSPG